jgi:hypothetical protein
MRSKILLSGYIGMNILTFLYLAAEDWREVSGPFKLLFCFAIDEFLALIWPIYWGILHWLR